ncbi:MAG: NADH-quinone oxidoreductase subunit H [Gemmatimonadota bacterium]
MNEPTGSAFLLLTATKAVVFFTLLMLTVAFLTLTERKVAAFIQDRSGPNRVGPWGLLQFVADGVKNLLKEETLPTAANRPFFLLAPLLAMVPATMLFAVIPFAAPLPTRWGVTQVMVADAPIGFLYVLAIASLGVYGVVLAGWSSGSKYSFLGGLRGSAQMVSYEVGLALSLVPVVLLAGDVRVPELVAFQQRYAAGAAPSLGLWFVLPLALGAFFFVVSGLAETNRLPFDLPEAEAELVAGYHTEYSAMKFSMFFIGEYAHLLTTAALVTVFFLGGWDIPGWSGDNIRILSDGTLVGDPAWWKTLLTLAAFAGKTGLVVVAFMWIRWTLPRFRYDQLMDLGWKFLIEAVTLYILVIAGLVLVLETMGMAPGPAYGGILFGANAVLAGILFLILDRGTLMRGGTFRSRREARSGAEHDAGRGGSGPPTPAPIVEGG